MTPEAQAALWTQIITGAFTIGGVFLTLLFANLQQRREDRRWMAGYYIEGRIEALTQFTRALYKLDDAIIDASLHSNDDPTNHEELLESCNNVLAQINAYADAASFARIYVTTEVQQQINDVAKSALKFYRALKALRDDTTNSTLRQALVPERDATRTHLWNVIRYIAAELNPPDLRSFHTAK